MLRIGRAARSDAGDAAECVHAALLAPRRGQITTYLCVRGREQRDAAQHPFGRRVLGLEVDARDEVEAGALGRLVHRARVAARHIDEWRRGPLGRDGAGDVQHGQRCEEYLEAQLPSVSPT